MERHLRQSEERPFILRRSFLKLTGIGIAAIGATITIKAIKPLVEFENEVGERAKYFCARSVSTPRPTEVSQKIIQDSNMQKCYLLMKDFIGNDYKTEREALINIALLGSGMCMLGVIDIAVSSISTSKSRI